MSPRDPLDPPGRRDDLPRPDARLPPGFLLRPESGGDRSAIHAVHGAAFETRAEADLVDALRAAGRLTLSLVATDPAGELVGHVAFSPATLEDAPVGLGLAPVGVRADRRRCGIAAALVTAGLDAAAAKGCPWVVVLGSPAYYERFGFRTASSRGLHDAFGGGEHFMVRELRAGSLPTAGGLVRYAPEFDVFLEDGPTDAP